MSARIDYQVTQEFITNGLLVTLNTEKVYFESIQDLQIFFKYWVEDDSLSIKECLELVKEFPEVIEG